jgi:hypothetical protein
VFGPAEAELQHRVDVVQAVVRAGRLAERRAMRSRDRRDLVIVRLVDVAAELEVRPRDAFPQEALVR